MNDDAIAWADAMNVYTRKLKANHKKRGAYVRRFTKAWDLWVHGEHDEPLPLPADWKMKIWDFHTFDLPIEELEDSVEIAVSETLDRPEDTFGYMCEVADEKVVDVHVDVQWIADGGDY